jgi:hypothetical protein
MRYDGKAESTALATASQRRSMRTPRQRRWAEGYLAGLARAFRRGNVTERAVCGAIGMAIIRGVEHAEVAQILDRYQLAWDATARRLSKTESPKE